MHIKQVKLRNFRSFSEEVVLSFSAHANIVVGRNGTGKSSLVVAIHFLMCGEKSFSGEYMEYVHEEGRLGEVSASVEIVFSNEDQRFPGQKEFVISRSIGARKDEYMLDGRSIPREEMIGLFQGAGICVDNPYFIVLQGRVEELAMLDERGIYELIKDVAGASKYEKDRGNSVRMIEDAKHTEEKVKLLLDRIEDKLEELGKEKKEMEIYDEYEREKRKLEYAYGEREVFELNEEICRIENQMPKDEESEEEESVLEMEDVGSEIERLLREKNRLVFDERYEGKESEMMEEIERIEKMMKRLKVDRDRDEAQLRKMRVEEGRSFVRINYYKNLIRFLNTFDGEVNEGEIENTKVALKKKLEELRISKGAEGKEAKEAVGSGDLEAAVERRKSLWRREKKLESSARSMADMLKTQESKLLVSGNSALSLYHQVCNEKGVLGCVYNLVDIPDELVDAFESVVGSSLFNVVVEDEEVASNLLEKMGNSLSAKITFMPLNRMEDRNEEVIKDPAVISLTSQLMCDPKYKLLMEYITRNSYLCSDLKSAVYASRRYNINVVTLDGDMVSKRGPISGGYERRSGFLKDYRRICGELSRCNEELLGVRSELKKVSGEIDEIKIHIDEEGANESKYGESLEAIVLFLREKLRILEEARAGKPSGVSLRKLLEEEKDQKYRSICMGNEIRRIEARMEEMGFNNRKLEDRMHVLKSGLEKARMCDEVRSIDNKLERLREEERKFRESMFNEGSKRLFVKPKKTNLEFEMLVARKHMLINRRNEICEKIGVSDFMNLERLYANKNKEEIVGELIRVNERIKKFPVFNKKVMSRWESHVNQKNSLKERLEELRCSREQIFMFMEELDARKEEAVELTLNMISEHFSSFYSRLTDGGRAELYKCEAGIGIRVDEESGNVNGLSGGQKALIALSLMFSIQRIDPSPFYVFDEVDANLDGPSRERVAMLINEMNTHGVNQFIITTFNKEMLQCGTRFFGMEFNGKRSSIREISKEAAHDFLDEDAVER